MRVLVLGAGGQVGRAVARVMAGQHEVIEKTREELDIGDAAAVGRVLADAKPDWLVNAAAYTAPVAGQWGTAGRDSITGPNQFSLDTALSRTFRLKDPFNLDIRLDATNLLNHGVFTAWNATVNSTTFGLPAAANPMRSIQVTGRLRF